MKPNHLLRAILPEVLIDNFDIDRFEKSDTRFDIWRRIVINLCLRIEIAKAKDEKFFISDTM